MKRRIKKLVKRSGYPQSNTPNALAWQPLTYRLFFNRTSAQQTSQFQIPNRRNFHLHPGVPLFFPSVIAVSQDDDEDNQINEAWLEAQLAHEQRILDLRAFDLTDEDIQLIRKYLSNNYLIVRILLKAPYKNLFDDILERNRQQFSERPNDYTYIKLSVLTYAQKDASQQQMSDEAVIQANLAKDLALNKDWRLLKTSTHKDGYFGAAYINDRTRQIIIANRGTQPDDMKELCKDIITDVRGVVRRLVDSQQPSALKFSREIKEAYGKDYKISVTGHSLGGWLAQVTLYHFVEEGYPSHAVTFDNPGARPMLESLLPNLQVERKVDLNQLDITVYLSAPNAINTCNPQLGICYRLNTQFGSQNPIINYLNYTLLAHDKAKILEQFDPKTGQVKSCRKVEDWPHLDVSRLGESNFGIGSWFLDKILNITFDLNKVKEQYNTFHDYANEENNYEPVLAKLSEHEQYYLQYQGHYKTLAMDPYELPFSQVSAPALKFLREYSDAKSWVDLKQCLKLNPGESIEDLKGLLAIDYQLEEQHQKRNLKIPSNSLITAKEFHRKLNLYLNCFPDLLQIKKFHGQNLRDMQRLLELQHFDTLDQQFQQQLKAAYAQVKSLSLQQNQARLYLYAEPKPEDVLTQEAEQNSIRMQIINYQQLETKLIRYEQSLKMPDSKVSRLKEQLAQQLYWLNIAEQYTHAMVCYLKRHYHKDEDSAGAEDLLNDLVSRLNACASENLLEIGKNQLIGNAYNLLAKIARTEGQYELAVKRYEAALTYQPNDPILLSSLGAALNDQAKFEFQQEKKHLNAWQFHLEAEKLLPKVTNKMTKSVIYANLGRGLQQLVESKQSLPDQMSALDLLQKAEYYLNKALELNPVNLTAHLFRGIVYMDMSSLTGEDKQTLAEGDFHAVLKLQDDHPTALRRQALLLQDKGNSEEALKLYKKARWSLEAKPWFPKSEKEMWLKDILQQTEVLELILKSKYPYPKM